MPLYYATGSKKKAFFWAFISGISEPIGAVVCYLAFYDGTFIIASVLVLVVGCSLHHQDYLI
jgi:ZIP family zinc transporter